MEVALAVAVGGALGALVRYGVFLSAVRLLGPSYPWSTLAVNVLGSFALGYLAVTLAQREGAALAQGLWMIGFLGALTTFSTFALEVVSMISAGQNQRAAVYVLASVLLAVTGAYAGMSIAPAR